MKVWESPFIPSHLTFKKFEFHSINHATIKQSIDLSIYYNIPKFRILGCYIYRVGVASEGIQGAHEVGGRPPPSWTGCGPPGLHLWRAFFIIYYKIFRGVSGHFENFCFLHIKQHHGNSAENSVSPGQFHSNHTSQSPKQGRKCLEKQIRRRIMAP